MTLTMIQNLRLLHVTNTLLNRFSLKRITLTTTRVITTLTSVANGTSIFRVCRLSIRDVTYKRNICSKGFDRPFSLHT